MHVYDPIKMHMKNVPACEKCEQEGVTGLAVKRTLFEQETRSEHFMNNVYICDSTQNAYENPTGLRKV